MKSYSVYANACLSVDNAVVIVLNAPNQRFTAFGLLLVSESADADATDPALRMDAAFLIEPRFLMEPDLPFKEPGFVLAELSFFNDSDFVAESAFVVVALNV